jgi:hypothetical protein
VLRQRESSLYPHIEGSTDSEVFFFLALTLGLEDDPPGAVARAVGLIEDTGRRHGVYPGTPFRNRATASSGPAKTSYTRSLPQAPVQTNGSAGSSSTR